MGHFKYYFDWLFKNLRGRKGGYVIAEVPNIPLVAFMILIVLAVVSYPGFTQSFFASLAYLALFIWSYQEARSGRSRFRKLLGILGLAAVVTALLLGLGY